jgi:sugar lactone lactonase YvrE
MRRATGKLMLGLAGAAIGLGIVLAVPALGRSARRQTVAAHPATVSIASAGARPAAETSAGSPLDPSLTSTSISPGSLAAPAASDPGGPFWDVHGSALESGEKSQISTGATFKLHTTLSTVECSEESGTGKVIGDNPGVDEATITFKGCHVEGATECKADKGEIKTEAYTLLAYPKGEKEKEAKALDAFLPKPESNNFAGIKFEGTGCGLLVGQEVPSDAVSTEIETPPFATKRKCGILAEIGRVKEGAFVVGKAKELTSEGALNFPTTAISEAEYWNGHEFKVITCKLESGIAGAATQIGVSKVTLSPAEEFGWVPLPPVQAAPTVTNLQPNAGPPSGGTRVTITGSGFVGATEVKFGQVKAPSFEVISEDSISAVSPAGSGTADVTVITPGGTSATSAADHFSYGVPPTVSTEFGVEAIPGNLAVDREGHIWVAEWYADAVKEFGEKGEVIREVSALASPCSGSLEGPFGVAVAPSGNVWVADSLHDRVVELSPEGKCLLQFGSQGSGEGQFNYPSGVAVGPNGHVWVTDTGNGRIQEFSESGEHLGQLGSFGSGQGQFQWPEGVAVDSEGHVWVSDVFGDRVQELSESGAFIGQIEARLPSTVAVDQHGNVFVPEFGGEEVREFNAHREFVTAFGSEASGAGQFRWPDGVAVESNGNLWLSDEGGKRIEGWIGAS